MIIHETQKFKTTIISIRFKEALGKENLGYRALLPQVLQAGTDHFTRKEIKERLEDLYGASLNVKAFKLGLTSVVQFELIIINPTFTDEPIFKDALSFLHNIIYDHKSFKKNDFDIEKRVLLEKINSFKNDKTSYAIYRLFEEMFKEDVYKLRTDGTVETVEGITLNGLYKYYQTMINENDIDVLLSGHITEDMRKQVSKVFMPRKQQELSIIDRNTLLDRDFKAVEELDHISQAKLNIGYRLPILYDDERRPAAVVFNTILGGSAQSRLFINVREKHSLCYYIGSQYDPFKGIMFIYSGIDLNRVDLALKVIKEQLEDLTKNITDHELNLAKAVLINQLKEQEDSQTRMMSFLYQKELLGLKDRDINKAIDELLSVTKEQVLEIAKMVKEDTRFILRPEANHGA